MRTYVFADPDSRTVLRSDGAIVPWPPQGFSAEVWQADGSSRPTAYAPPPFVTNDVDAYAKARLASGFVDAITGKTWQCDDASLLKWTALAASAGLAIVMNITPLPTFPVIAEDNSVVVLTSAQVFSLFSARVLPWVSATIFYARSMKNNILANNAPADITIGWP
jgi:hypothetical protein